MNEIVYLLDLLKFVVAGLIVFFVAWFVVKEFVSEKLNFQTQELRKAGQFDEADKMRQKVEAKGYIVEDTAAGPKVKKP